MADPGFSLRFSCGFWGRTQDFHADFGKRNSGTKIFMSFGSRPRLDKGHSSQKHICRSTPDHVMDLTKLGFWNSMLLEMQLSYLLLFIFSLFFCFSFLNFGVKL